MRIDFGTLHLPADAPAPVGAAWADVPVNTVLVILSALACLIWLSDLLRLMPQLLECASRVRPNLSLEHSLHQARSRDFAAFVMLIPFCLLTDRYGLYQPGFIASLQPEWHVAALLGVLVGWLLLRKAIAAITLAIRPPRLDSESRSARLKVLYNCFVLTVPLMLLTAFVASFFFKAPDGTVRSILWAEVGLMYLVSLLRGGQILRTGCSALSTFLYLCALELIPVAALVASAVIL